MERLLRLRSFSPLNKRREALFLPTHHRKVIMSVKIELVFASVQEAANALAAGRPTTAALTPACAGEGRDREGRT